MTEEEKKTETEKTENKVEETKTSTKTETPQDDDFSKLPDWAQKNIKELREENKQRRLENTTLSEKFSGLEGSLKKVFGGKDEEKYDPKDVIEELAMRAEQLEVENALITVAHENDIPKDKMNYFSYLLKQATDLLDEGEELPGEEFEKIVNNVKAVSAKKGAANSSVGSGNNRTDSQGGTEGPTYEEFLKMDNVQKTELYRKSPKLYEQYFADSKKKGDLFKQLNPIGLNL